MSLTQELAEYIRACFSGLWIETCEPSEAVHEIAELCRQENWRLDSAPDPLAAVRMAEQLAPEAGSAGLLALENFHRFLGSAEIVQALVGQVQVGKQLRTFVVILAPTVELPPELEKLFVVLEHPLPDKAQLHTIARELVACEEELPTAAALDAVLEAAAGLSPYQAEGAYSLALVREGRITPQVIWSVKAQQLKKTSLVSLQEGPERFCDLGGMESLKVFCLRALRANRTTVCQPRGVLLVSPPGCGKSAFCKTLGNEVRRPTLRLDIGALMGLLVGETERNVRRALAIAEAMAPCIRFIDEIDKGLAGVLGDNGRLRGFRKDDDRPQDRNS